MGTPGATLGSADVVLCYCQFGGGMGTMVVAFLPNCTFHAGHLLIAGWRHLHP